MRFLAVALLLIAYPLAAQKRVEPARRDGSFFAQDGTDKFTGVSVLSTPTAKLSGGPPKQSLSLAFRRTRDTSGVYRFGILAVYRGDDWIFMSESAGELKFLASGQSIALDLAGRPSREVDKTGSSTRWSSPEVKVNEVGIFPVEPTILFQLARAESIDWRIDGDKGRVEGRAKPANFDKLRVFLATVFPDSVLYEKK